MIDKVIKEVDGISYEIWTLPVPKALSILTKLTKLAGELGGGAIGSVDSGQNPFQNKSGEKNPMNIKMDVLGKAITALTNRLDESEVQEIIKTMLSVVHVQNVNGYAPVSFDVTFQGRIFHMLKVVGAALEVNYSDFLEGLSVLKGFAQKMITLTQVKSTSMPESGASGSPETQV